MNYKMMGRFIAQILSIEGIFMLPALIISLFCTEIGAAHGANILFCDGLSAVRERVVRELVALSG